MEGGWGGRENGGRRGVYFEEVEPAHEDGGQEKGAEEGLPHLEQPIDPNFINWKG